MCKSLGILTPTAMRLLWLRQTAQIAPETLPVRSFQDVIQVVLHLDKRPKATLTARDLWRTIARFGATSTAKVTRLRDGRPYGKAGYVFRRSLKAFISHVNFSLMIGI